MPVRDITQIRYDLEQTFQLLTATKDPSRNQALLRQLSLLLREIHHLAVVDDEVAA